MDDDFISGIYDDLSNIDEGMTKDQILSAVDSVIGSIESEMGWDQDDEEPEVEERD